MLGFQTRTWRTITLRGSCRFIDATTRALDVLDDTIYLKPICKQVAKLRQRHFLKSRIRWGAGTALVGSELWCLDAIEYAVELLRIASRCEHYHLPFPVADPEFEVHCTLLAMEALSELGADELVLERSFRRFVLESLAFVQDLNQLPKSSAICSQKPRGWLRSDGTQWRHRVDFDGIEIYGCKRFVKNTCRTLQLLQLSKEYPVITGNIAIIREMTRKFHSVACIYVSLTRPKVLIAASLGESGECMEYAEALAHEAYHNVLFRKGEAYDGPEAELTCMGYEKYLLADLAMRTGTADQEVNSEISDDFQADPWQRLNWRMRFNE